MIDARSYCHDKMRCNDKSSVDTPSRPGAGQQYLCKLAVGFLVGLPLEVECAGVAQLALQVEGDVVEQLPQHAVAEAIVVQIHLQPNSMTCKALPFELTYCVVRKEGCSQTSSTADAKVAALQVHLQQCPLVCCGESCVHSDSSRQAASAPVNCCRSICKCKSTCTSAYCGKASVFVTLDLWL